MCFFFLSKKTKIEYKRQSRGIVANDNNSVFVSIIEQLYINHLPKIIIY